MPTIQGNNFAIVNLQLFGKGAATAEEALTAVSGGRSTPMRPNMI